MLPVGMSSICRLAVRIWIGSKNSNQNSRLFCENIASLGLFTSAIQFAFDAVSANERADRLYPHIQNSFAA